MSNAENMINQTGLGVILLQNRLAELEAENANQKEVIGALERANSHFFKNNIALRAALEAVEYDVHGFCLWCAGDEESAIGHYSNCQRQAALGLTTDV